VIVAFVMTASPLAAAVVTSSSSTVVVPAPFPRGALPSFWGGGRGALSLLSLFAFVLPASSRRRPALSSSGWGMTTGPHRLPPAMSSPSGDVVATPFVRADDNNDGTAAPLQGSAFFEDIKGD
jgi:hypothetical protein